MKVICNIHQHCNDMQYYDNAKDGVSMNKRIFVSFVKEIIKEYGDINDNNVSISLSSLPFHIQKEYLKQWMFFEGYIEYYQEIFLDQHKIEAAIEEEKENLNFWLKEYSNEIAEEFFDYYVHENNLCVHHHRDNGEAYLIRR